MPLFFADLVPGSDTYLYQETLYRSESRKRRLRRTAGLQGWPLKFVQHVADAPCIPPSPAGHRELIICPIDSNGDSLVFDSLFCISEYM